MAKDPKPSEITPEGLYLNRRNFIRAGLLAGTSVATTLAYRYFNPQPEKPTPLSNNDDIRNITKTRNPLDEKQNTFEEISNYNNFYEFSTDKRAVAVKSRDMATRPWSVEVGGLVQDPGIFDIEELLRFDQEERIYRFRCVEAWSMVIPWIGFPLKALLDRVQPLSSARYVAFETLYDSKLMQSSFSAGIDFPYVEGLRMDEALHPLTILATGLYGKLMPNQNGAPIRLVVPWKYGFKSIKSIVKITLTDTEPPTTWNIAAPDEYGFYSNVNPNVDHPRWSQATERRIGEIGRRDTLLFNGYADEVAHLYAGMDLEKNF
ncbi:MAG TPA: protein-methionine-sulfoxide reductase catalytic subunit MsrP [Pyrinomonadaceae bacterium]